MKKTNKKNSKTAETKTADFSTDKHGNFIAPMGLPPRKGQEVKAETAVPVPAVESWKDKLAKSIGQSSVTERAAFPLALLSKGRSPFPLKALYLRAPAGTGKTGTARRIAETGGLDFAVCPQGVTLTELIEGQDIKKGGNWPGIAKFCSLETAGPRMIYMDEFHGAAPEVRAWIMEAVDPECETKGGENWRFDPCRVWLVVGTNEGIANAALCGASGRFIDCPLDCLSPERVRSYAVEKAREIGFKLSPGAVEMVALYAAPTYRGVENIVYVTAGVTMGADAKAADVLKAVKPSADGESSYAPDGMEPIAANILRVLAKQTSPMLVGSLKDKSGAAQLRTGVFASHLANIRGQGFAMTVPGGVLMTHEGMKYVKALNGRIQAILALDTVKGKRGAK